MNKFTQETSDVQFQSSDGQLFNLHKSLLESHTGAFPGPEVNTCGEIVQLTESGKILELLFAFVYPKRYPDLDDESFETVIELAEAVGKYEVYSAMSPCNSRLKYFLPDHAVEILAYSLKHDHLKLADEAALLLARKPIIPVLKQLPMQYLIAWTEYHSVWASLFTETVEEIRKAPAECSADPSSMCHGNDTCSLCRSSQFIWITDLQTSKDSVYELRLALAQAIKGSYTENVRTCCKDMLVSKPQPRTDLGQHLYQNAMSRPALPPTYHPWCTAITGLARRLDDGVSKVKSFSTYISKTGDSS